MIIDDVAAKCGNDDEKIDTRECQEAQRNPEISGMHEEVARVHPERAE